MKRRAKIALGISAGFVGAVLLGTALFFFFVFVPISTAIFYDCTFPPKEAMIGPQHVTWNFALKQSRRGEENVLRNKVNGKYFALEVTLTYEDGTTTSMQVTQLKKFKIDIPPKGDEYFARFVSDDGKHDFVARMKISGKTSNNWIKMSVSFYIHDGRYFDGYDSFQVYGKV